MLDYLAKALPGTPSATLASAPDIDVTDALGRAPVDAALGRITGRNNVVSEEIAARLRVARGEPIAAR